MCRCSLLGAVDRCGGSLGPPSSQAPSNKTAAAIVAPRALKMPVLARHRRNTHPGETVRRSTPLPRDDIVIFDIVSNLMSKYVDQFGHGPGPAEQLK